MTVPVTKAKSEAGPQWHNGARGTLFVCGPKSFKKRKRSSTTSIHVSAQIVIVSFVNSYRHALTCTFGAHGKVWNIPETFLSNHLVVSDTLSPPRYLSLSKAPRDNGPQGRSAPVPAPSGLWLPEHMPRPGSSCPRPRPAPSHHFHQGTALRPPQVLPESSGNNSVAPYWRLGSPQVQTIIEALSFS